MNASKLHDIVSRSLSVIEESDGADEHAELIQQLRVLVSDIADCAMTSTEMIFSDASPLPSEQTDR